MMEHQPRRISCAIILAVGFTSSQIVAKTVWNEDMSSISAWNEASNATHEAGPSTGGIRVLNNHVQMNSWWDNAGYTHMWTNTGVLIQDETDYTLIVRMVSYANGKQVKIKMESITDGGAPIVEKSPSPSTSRFTDYSISFATIGRANGHLIGDTIGVVITPDWWNNVAITNVSIEAVDSSVIHDAISPRPNPMAWRIPPFARTATSISMIAQTARDELNEVEYLFECVTDSNFSSPWQSSPLYTCYGLETGAEYSFRVKARDTSLNQNETGFSDPAAAIPKVTLAHYPAVLPGTGGDLTTADPSQLTITIDLADQRQTITGFGASDCWSAQYIGQWPVAKRNAIADLLFETNLNHENNPVGVGLSIWRMNLGAGSVRQGNIYDVWRRSDVYLSSRLDEYDWTRCPGQRNFLQMAKARGVEHFIAFCNSPPFTMTKNGYTFCDPSVGSTNLDSARRNEFAVYLADVLEHFQNAEDIHFTSLSPFNEPEWDWNENANDPGHGWQEGCRYSNYEMKTFVDVLYAEMQSRGLDTQLDLCDSGRIDYLYANGGFNGNHIYQFFDESSSHFIGDKLPATISSHSYWTDTLETGLILKRQRLRDQLDLYALDYAQTEYCILGDYGNGRDLGIDPALHIARTMHFDLTIAQATSWQWWLGVSPGDYKDGLVYTDDDRTDGDFYDSKMLWAVGNYARFIRPGMKRVHVSRSDSATPAETTEGLMASSYYGASYDVGVTVVVNRKDADIPIQLDYRNLPAEKRVSHIVPYVTSSTGSLTAYAALSVTDTINIPAKSIVTLVSLHVIPSEPEPDGETAVTQNQGHMRLSSEDETTVEL